MRFAIAILLVGVSTATGFYLVLPCVFHKDFYCEPNPFIAWGEFATCMACAVLGFIGAYRELRGGK